MEGIRLEELNPLFRYNPTPNINKWVKREGGREDGCQPLTLFLVLYKNTNIWGVIETLEEIDLRLSFGGLIKVVSGEY